MWNNAYQLKKAANALFALAMLIAFITVGLWLIQQPAFMLRTLAIEGEVAHINGRVVHAALTGHLRRSLFTTNLEAVRATLASIPWVRTASVRRIWPNQIIAEISEYQPVGIWGKNQLISVDGELFAAHPTELDGELPQLRGPKGSEKEVIARYWAFKRWFAPLGIDLQSVILSARYAWTVRLANGMRIELGRERDQDTLEKRSQRLVFAWPKMIKQWGLNIESVDLQYPNGFAIRVINAQQNGRDGYTIDDKTNTF